MRIYISIIGLLFLASTIISQETYSGGGLLFAKRYKRSREPIQVVDTVRLTAGSGILVLQKQFGKGRHSTIPTSSDNIFVTLTLKMDSSNQDINSYAWYFSGDTIYVVSSDNTDAGKLNIRAIIK